MAMFFLKITINNTCTYLDPK